MIENPALKAFVAQIGGELLLAQVLIRRASKGYELRHADDASAPPETLREIKPADARTLAQLTAANEFRPLKSAPTLQKGWRITAPNDPELDLALSGLYPGAVADWFAAQASHPPVTNFREFTARQSGMYRITAKLSDDRAIEVISQCCAPSLCLKRRLWTVAYLPPDGPQDKSLIPCLEPCALLLEAARKAARKELDAACTDAEPGQY